MEDKKKSPSGRELRLENGNADGRGQRVQLQDTQPTGKLQDFEQYRRAARRMLADAFVTLRQFPARLRFSYVVDRHGRLRPLTERRAGT